jgi:hypothetical protein
MLGNKVDEGGSRFRGGVLFVLNCTTAGRLTVKNRGKESHAVLILETVVPSSSLRVEGCLTHRSAWSRHTPFSRELLMTGNFIGFQPKLQSEGFYATK